MEAFLDWVTEPYNYKRLNKKSSKYGERAVDLYGEISKFVFEKHKVDWDVKHVKYRMSNARKKYDAAKALSEITGRGETRDLDLLCKEERLLICPPFDRLDVVWGGTLTRDPPPARETCNRSYEDYFNGESSPEVIEIDEEDEEEDATSAEDEDRIEESMCIWMTCMLCCFLLSCKPTF